MYCAYDCWWFQHLPVLHEVQERESKLQTVGSGELNETVSFKSLHKSYLCGRQRQADAVGAQSVENPQLPADCYNAVAGERLCRTERAAVACRLHGHIAGSFEKCWYI